jgi:Ca2+:H+ antiporter
MIVRTSLLRSIIVNLLLVFGLAIVTGEAQQRGQAYNILATRMAAGTLCLTTILLLVPSALRISSDKFEVSDANLALSRDISIVLILVYGIYLVSQIKSTKYAYKPLIQLDPDDCEQLEVVPIDYINQSSYHRRTLSYPRHPTTLSSFDDLLSYHSPKQATISRIVARIETIKSIPWIRKTLPIASFIVSTGFISISGGYLVDSIDHFVDHSPVSKIMIGLIILPIVGNAAELLSGIMFASRKQMNLAFAVAIGSAIQITLFITPLIVVVGWGLGREMALNFTHFEALALITSTALFSSLIHDDRCSLLKGVGLVAGYTVIT